MMKQFMNKMGGEGTCKAMKQDFCQTMKHGTEEQKQEQFAKMGDMMKEFGEHMKDFKPEFPDNSNAPFGQTWDKNMHAQYTKAGADGEYVQHSWNAQRAVVQKKPEGVLEGCPGTALIEDLEILNDTFWPWKRGCVLTLHEEQSFTECPIEIINVPIE